MGHSVSLNILLLLGVGLLGGILGGRLLHKLRMPQVVGFIIIGAFLGVSFFKIIDAKIIARLEPFSYFALGLIGFRVGGELKIDIFKKYGRQLTTILLWEAITPFFLTSLFISTVYGLFFGNWPLAIGLGLLFGAIASVTDPAATTEVLREYKTRGPLTRTILGIAALDDGLALLLFVIASSFTAILNGAGGAGFSVTFLYPVYEIGGAILVGSGLGFLLVKISKRYADEPRILAFSLAIILLTCGLAIAVGVDMLLAAMTLGVVAVNFTPRKRKDVFKVIEAATSPVYIVFFVLVGARLDIYQLTPVTLLLVGLYLVGMASGKIFGSRFGAVIAGAPQTVKRYLSFSMFPQAGISIGLAILAAHRFPGPIGDTVVIVTAAATFVSQLFGPALTKYSLTCANEIGLNITEEDLADTTTAGDVMDSNPPLIYKNTHLSEILDIFGKSDNLYYPVVDKSKKVLGVVTLEGIRNIFMESSLSDLLLAVDLMEKIPAAVSIQSTLAAIKEAMLEHDLEYIPVLDREGIIQGFIEKRSLNHYIATKILELQRMADSLEAGSEELA
jgi:Kef-type K+ transport system membrane component KefB